MPRVFINDADRIVDRELKRLHARVLVAGYKNSDIARWLDCTPQNVGYLWKNNSFSWKQILIIQERLKDFEDSI